MGLRIPSKVPLTEEDIKWCEEALANAEPYSDEKTKYIKLDESIHEIDFDRDAATMAKKMLERGWKYKY